MSNHRDWSSLPVTPIVLTAERLNAVDHVNFRSVCMGWRGQTQERRKAPLLILVDLDNRLHHIKALSFFDIIRKEIIPLRLLASFHVSNCHYLGSSHGWIFVGQVPVARQSRLRIRLVNPFTNEYIHLPWLTNPPHGRLFLLKSSEHHRVIYVYYVASSDIGNASQVNFLRDDEREWSTFWLVTPPDDVVAIGDRLFANDGGVLTEINLEAGRRLGRKVLLPGLHKAMSSDSTLFLRFFEDFRSRLYLLFTASQERSHCFISVDVHDMGGIDVNSFEPPSFFEGQRFLLIRDHDFTVEPQSPQHDVLVGDYYPFLLLLRLSRFWANDQNRWEPVGWITPLLREI
ncbi:hypothetical protein IHE45_17G099900 [Dioscorea alata]|uniref:Uncharacterized protein n=1 Tax=Dioscorea alata TaxID=55571 RepID=A0ACB7UEH9_DIOAL|nr:hypothetical protein IHE45_17G099900 [Dioscorea alata]